MILFYFLLFVIAITILQDYTARKKRERYEQDNPPAKSDPETFDELLARVTQYLADYKNEESIESIPFSPTYLGDMYMSSEAKTAYLASDEWKALRKKVHTRDNICKFCCTRYRLEVHHITYERLGAEHLSDLVLLCRTCHQKIHDQLGYDRETKYPILILRSI